MLVTADLDNEIAIKTGENIWKEMPFQLCLSPAVISYLFLQNAKLLEGCVCVFLCANKPPDSSPYSLLPVVIRYDSVFK